MTKAELAKAILAWAEQTKADTRNQWNRDEVGRAIKTVAGKHWKGLARGIHSPRHKQPDQGFVW